MACPCCDTSNIVDCFGCLFDKTKTLYLTISTSSGAPFKNTVTTFNGKPIISLLPDTASLVYRAPPQLFGDELCGPACAAAPTAECPTLVTHSETSSYSPRWYSTERECVSSFFRYTTLQTGTLIPVYALNCNVLTVFSYSMTVRQAIAQNVVDNFCVRQSLPDCDVVANVGSGINVIASFTVPIRSCNPLLLQSSLFPAGEYGGFFGGLFNDPFVVTITE